MPSSIIPGDAGNLPEELREYFHLKKGDPVEFVVGDDGKVVVQPVLSARSAFGMFHTPGMRPVTIREMDEAVGRFLAEEDERIRKGKA